MTKVLIIKTGIANTASVEAAFRRCRVNPILSDDPQQIADAEQVVLPGVGAFGPAMAKLRQTGIDEVLISRINADKPLLGICLGMQLLFANSAESPDVEGLAVFDTKISLISGAELRVPHFGWNEVQPFGQTQYLSPGYAYFAHSFRAKFNDFNELAKSGARSTYGVPFISAIEQGRLLACQFHPELSGVWGAQVLQNWLEGTC
ncbi:MAG: imidazole glycerol phosphate synthase subunit HisH [Myxococcales bacterium]|nr:imidazole glycerol phosphate synthase subunit HisH [Myxococcales bacterium]